VRPAAGPRVASVLGLQAVLAAAEPIEGPEALQALTAAPERRVVPPASEVLRAEPRDEGVWLWRAPPAAAPYPRRAAPLDASVTLASPAAAWPARQAAEASSAPQEAAEARVGTSVAPPPPVDHQARQADAEAVGRGRLRRAGQASSAARRLGGPAP
jgi:hypothetical protein